MVKSLNIDKMLIPENYQEASEIKIVCDINDFSTNESKISQKTVTIPITEFYNFAKQNNYLSGNFYFNNNFPKPLDKFFQPTTIGLGENIEISKSNIDEQITVTYILDKLSKLQSRLQFRPEYYNEKTGGATFESFKPNFEETEMNAKNLIISNKKFNIVLTASIKGEIEFEGGVTEVYRYHPFKLVKQGKLSHDKLYVYVDNKNKPFLDSLGLNTSTEIVEILLTEYPIFEEHKVHATFPNLMSLVSRINQNKEKVKGYGFYLKRLRQKLSEKDLTYQQREWFRGESVDDDYISDEGTGYLSVWIKGEQSSISVNKLLESLDKFGDNINAMVNMFTNMEDVQSSEVSEPIKMAMEVITNLLKNEIIKQREAIMLASLMDALQSSGTLKDRIRTIGEKLNDIAIELNTLELKFLTLRWKLYKSLTEEKMFENRNIYSLGEIGHTTENSIDVYSPAGGKTLVIKKGIITKPTTVWKGIETVNQIITENVEGV